MTKSTTEKLADARMEGNFPVDQYMIDEFDPVTGVVKFTKRISRQDRFLNKAGQEIPDPRPMSPALGRKPETTIRDYVATLVRSERLAQEAEAAGFETFEEANDFEVGDDYFPDSQYENDLEPSLAELVREGTASLSAKARAQEKRDYNAKLKRREELADANADSSAQEPSKKRRKARDPAPEADPAPEPDSDLQDLP